MEEMDSGIGVDIQELQQAFHAEEQTFAEEQAEDPCAEWLSLGMALSTQRAIKDEAERTAASAAQAIAALELALAELEQTAQLPVQRIGTRAYLPLPDDSGVQFIDGEQMSWRELSLYMQRLLATPMPTPAQPAVQPATTQKGETTAEKQLTVPMRKGRKPVRYSGTLDDLKAEVASGDWRHARFDWASEPVQQFLRSVKDVQKRLTFIHAAISSDDRIAYADMHLSAWQSA